MDQEVIYIIDELTPRPGEARAVLAEYMERYAPGARAAGMDLERVLVTPPLWLDEDSNRLTISWTMQGKSAFRHATHAARAIPENLRWWQDIDPRLIDRRRSVHVPADQAEGAADA